MDNLQKAVPPRCASGRAMSIEDLCEKIVEGHEVMRLHLIVDIPKDFDIGELIRHIEDKKGIVENQYVTVHRVGEKWNEQRTTRAAEIGS
jgi:hypothetical protein